MSNYQWKYLYNYLFLNNIQLFLKFDKTNILSIIHYKINNFNFLKKLVINNNLIIQQK